MKLLVSALTIFCLFALVGNTVAIFQGDNVGIRLVVEVVLFGILIFLAVKKKQ